MVVNREYFMIIDIYGQLVECGLCEDYTNVQKKRTIKKLKFMRDHGKDIEFPRRFQSPPKIKFTIKDFNEAISERLEDRVCELMGDER